MPNGIALSLVVPFYNGIGDVFAHLERLGSDDERYEIVFVNDGSTDCSAEELAGRIEAYGNARMVSYDDNKGVSTARNKGIRAARGDYVWMVDADDVVTQNSVIRVVECIESMRCGFDSLFFAWGAEVCGLDARQSIPLTELARDEAFMRVYKYDGYVWDKVFSRQAIIENEISFDARLFWAEDKLFCAQFLSASKGKLYLTPEVLYCHKKREASFTGSKNVDKKRLTLIDSKQKLLELAARLRVEGLRDIAQADLLADTLMLLFRLIKQRPDGWRGLWRKYWSIAAPYREAYLKGPGLSLKYRHFLGLCPVIDFVIRKTKEEAA